MSEKENTIALQNATREVNTLISATNESVRREYNSSMVRVIEYTKIHSGASQNEKNTFIAKLTQEYKNKVEALISSLDTKYRMSVANALCGVLGTKPPNLDSGISAEKGRIISAAVKAFQKEAKLLMDTRSEVARPFAAGEELSQFQDMIGGSSIFSSPKKLSKWNLSTYGTPSATKDSQGMLEDLLTRCAVQEDYALRIALLEDVPQVKGYRVEVAKTNKYGKARKSDICDVLAGDYPKGFKFRGWHYNCRCVLRPLVDKNYITPSMIAEGCIGVDSDAKVAVSDAARSFLTKNANEYQRAFPAIGEYTYVDFKGEKRFLADMGANEKSSFYMEDLIKGVDFFPKMERNIEVCIKKFNDKKTFMETQHLPEGSKIAMREDMEKDLISAFAKKGTGVALTPAQINASASALHEMLHSLVKEYSAPQAINSKEVAVQTAINYHMGFGVERDVVELFTEWKMRSMYPQVMTSYGLALPAEYKKAISKGYNREIKNFQKFLDRVNDKDAILSFIDESLLEPNKAVVATKFKNILKEKRIVKSKADIDFLVEDIIYNDNSKEYDMTLEKNLMKRTPSKALATSAAVAISAKNDAIRNEVNKSLADMGWGSQVKKIGDTDVHANGLMVENAVLKNMVKGASVVGGAVVVTQGVKRGLEVEEEKDKRYLPLSYYKDSYNDAVMCGFIDGAFGLVDAGKDMVSSIGLYSLLAVGNGLSRYPIFGRKMNDKLKEVSLGFVQTQVGIASTVTDVADFTVSYATDVEFRTAVNEVIMRECKDYFSAMGGVSPENGYRQGRAVFDLINLLAGGGLLKNVMVTWRRTKSLDELTRVVRMARFNNAKKALPPKVFKN